MPMENHFCETNVGFTSQKQDRVKRSRKIEKKRKARNIEKSDGCIIEERRESKKKKKRRCKREKV